MTTFSSDRGCFLIATKMAATALHTAARNYVLVFKTIVVVRYCVYLEINIEYNSNFMLGGGGGELIINVSSILVFIATNPQYFYCI